MPPLGPIDRPMAATPGSPKRILLTLALAALALLQLSCGEILQQADQAFATEATGAEVCKIATNIFSTSTYLGSTQAHHFILIDDHPPFIHGWSRLYKVPRRELQAGLEFPYLGPLKKGKRVIFQQNPSDHSIGFQAP